MFRRGLHPAGAHPQKDNRVKKLIATISLFAALLGLTACGGGIDRDGTVELLVNDFGMTTEQAECAVDGALDTDIPNDVLTGEKEATEAQQAELIEITADCILENQ